jgi:hypothetical protein
MADAKPCRCADLEGIHRLLAEYGRLLDARDAEGWAALFAPDGCWDGGDTYGMIAGHDRLADFIRSEFAGTAPCAHMFGTPAIAIAADGAHATAWSRWLLIEEESGTLRPALCGSYSDRLVKLGDGWRFDLRVVALTLPTAA